MRVLNLTLKKKWFDMIASGEKKEEYREIKPYWTKRFVTRMSENTFLLKPFDAVRFTNGYSKDSPSLTVRFKGMSIREGEEKWGAEKGLQYYVIHLGKPL